MCIVGGLLLFAFAFDFGLPLRFVLLFWFVSLSGCVGVLFVALCVVMVCCCFCSFMFGALLSVCLFWVVAVVVD